MARKKILWLCSWYPDKEQPFNGDFVQRHAYAAALFNDIYVLHVTGTDLTETSEEKISSSGQLTEHLLYFKRASFLKKLKNYYRWNSSYKKAVTQYIKQFGLPDLIHVHVPMRDGLIAARLNKKYGISYVLTEHWTIYQPQNDLPFEKQPPLFRSLLKWIVEKSSMLLPVSRDLGDRMNQLVARKEFTVIENAADTGLFFYNERKKPDGRFRFIHVSGMSYQKNTEGLIGAFIEFNRLHPETELLLVGPVPLSIQELLNSSGLLDTVIFLTGEINYSQVAARMQESDAFVLFSRYENSPCSIIEALCCGLPVIATRVGGIPELINESNGILVEPGSLDELVKALADTYIGYDNFDRQHISNEAMARFNYEVIGKKLDEVYSSLSNR